MVEIVGSVAPDEVPEGELPRGRPGKWSALANQILADYDAHRVTVVKVTDNKELTSMRTGLGPPLKRQGKKLRPVIVRQGSEIRVFCEVILQPIAEKNGTS